MDKKGKQTGTWNGTRLQLLSGKSAGQNAGALMSAVCGAIVPVLCQVYPALL